VALQPRHAIVVHFVNFIIIGFLLRKLLTYYLCSLLAAKSLRIRLKEDAKSYVWKYFGRTVHYNGNTVNAFCLMIKLTPLRAAAAASKYHAPPPPTKVDQRAAAAAEPKHPVRRRRPNVIGVGSSPPGLEKS